MDTYHLNTIQGRLHKLDIREGKKNRYATFTLHMDSRVGYKHRDEVEDPIEGEERCFTKNENAIAVLESARRGDTLLVKGFTNYETVMWKGDVRCFGNLEVELVEVVAAEDVPAAEPAQDDDELPFR